MHNNRQTYLESPETHLHHKYNHKPNISQLKQNKKLQFNNAVKFKQLQEIKTNNIDELNLKIINLINRLSIDNEGKGEYQNVGEHKRGKERMRTDYGCYGMDDYHNSKGGMDCYQFNYEIKENKLNRQNDKFKISNEIYSVQNENVYKKKDIQSIRKKYKQNDGQMIRRDKSTSVLSHFSSSSSTHVNTFSQIEGHSNSNSHTKNNHSNHNIDDELISFKRKLTPRQFKLKITQTPLPKKSILKTQPTTTTTYPYIIQDHNNNDRIINQYKAYQKKLLNYNQHKSALFNTTADIHQQNNVVQRVPLKDRSNNYQNNWRDNNNMDMDFDNMFKKNSNNRQTQVQALKYENNKDCEFKFYEEQANHERNNMQSTTTALSYNNDKSCTLLNQLMQGFKQKLSQAKSTPYTNNYMPPSQIFNQSQSSQSMMLKSLISAINKSNQTYQEQSLIDDINHDYNNVDNSQPMTADFRQNNQLQHLISNLKEQIKLDMIFRNAKKWFQRCSSKNKWQELLLASNSKNLNFTQAQILEIFSIKQQQQNPFYNPKPSQYSIPLLVDTFLQSEQHWYQNIIKSYKYSSLVNYGFTRFKLDRLQKGYVQINDLVRFVNAQSKENYHNRDMVLIFERLRSQEKLKFDDLIDIICQ